MKETLLLILSWLITIFWSICEVPEHEWNFSIAFWKLGSWHKLIFDDIGFTSKLLNMSLFIYKYLSL